MQMKLDVFAEIKRLLFADIMSIRKWPLNNIKAHQLLAGDYLLIYPTTTTEEIILFPANLGISPKLKFNAVLNDSRYLLPAILEESPKLKFNVVLNDARYRKLTY